jgi:hypothetical protein
MVNSFRRGPRYNRPYDDSRGVIEQFRPGECKVRLVAEYGLSAVQTSKLPGVENLFSLFESKAHLV